MTPEEKAREKIDAMLTASGWAVQTKDRINLSASRGVAVCELSFATGEPDYSRLESPGYEGHSLSMLRRVAKVLHARVRVVIETDSPGKAEALAEAPTPYRVKRTGPKSS
jgi:hypothetical protein